MDSKDMRKLRSGVVTGRSATRASDPAFYSFLRVLPNPDPILRAMGKAEQAYDAIMSDAHVIGELRSMRSGVLSYKPKVIADDQADESDIQQAALETCQGILRRRPAPGMLWQDVIWNMHTAVLRGHRVHEVDWQFQDGQLLPDGLYDIPNRRIRFDDDNQLRLLTKAQPIEGEETEDYKYLVTRHMPTQENPYGQALLSACFWPYTFKHGGFKFLYQFCDRVGVPFPVGRYPEGTDEKAQDDLLDALLDMLEKGVAVVPEGDAIELLTVSHSGELTQERLVQLCNREMSKALTSQTLATELGKAGSNAAAKTHSQREQGVHESDRALIEATMNKLFSDITRFNYGPDVIPPKCELFKPKQISKERVEIWKIAAEIGSPSRKAFHKETGIPEAEDEADRLEASQPTSQFSKYGPTLDFRKPTETLETAAIRQADQVIEQDLLRPAYQMLLEFESQGKTLDDFLESMPELFESLNTKELGELNGQIMAQAMAEGMVRG